MRLRAIAVSIAALCVLAAVAAFAVSRAVRADGHGYLVRAVFLNSSFVTTGEQVKVAGVPVGSIHAVQLTQDNEAAVVLSITNRRFIPFRADAHCDIDLESLLGEQYVQCVPTQPRSAGAPAPAPLPRIRSGAGAGEHLLPVSGTTTPVGFDLLLDMNRLPLEERLRLIIAGLGTGLDANGQQLNLALQRADPALQQTDRVIAVLGDQDRTIAQLTDESARVLAPLSAQRRHLGGFIDHGGAVAAAAASEANAIQANLADFPAFLRQLGPAAARLSRLSQAATPTLDQLDAHAAQINTTVAELGPLARGATPALTTLGTVADRARTVFPQAHASAAALLALSRPLVPVADDLAATASSFDEAGGIEDVMRFIYYYTGAVNGEDSLGHYIRSLLEIGSCAPRVPPSLASPSCSANFKALAQLQSPESRRAPAAPTPAAGGSSAAIVAAALRSTQRSDPSPDAGLGPVASYLLGR